MYVLSLRPINLATLNTPWNKKRNVFKNFCLDAIDKIAKVNAEQKKFSSLL